jgi:hypothetical protein
MLASSHHWCKHEGVRTTVNLDGDVAAAAEQLAREKHIGLGAAVNELARAGLRQKPKRHEFRVEATNMGARIDVTNIGEALELLDEWDAEDRGR